MLPPLILTPDRLAHFPPGIQTGTVLHTFCVQADAGKIQAALDAQFNTPSGGAVSYQALGSKIFVSVAEIARMISADPIDATHGWMKEIDVTVWVLARCAGGLSMRWLPLWLFVDTSPAMVTGREIYGFPKQIGRFDFTPQGQEPRNFNTTAFVTPEFTAQTQAIWAPMISIRPSDDPPEPDAGLTWNGLEDFAKHAIQRLQLGLVDADLAMMSAATQALGVGQSTLAFLKQFPDAAAPHLACYQAIIEVDTKVLTLRGVQMTQTPYVIEIFAYASHPILDQFGVAPGEQSVGHGVIVDFDFSVGMGREVWKAS